MRTKEELIVEMGKLRIEILDELNNSVNYKVLIDLGKKEDELYNKYIEIRGLK